jgi:hypothetical protein
MFRFSDPQRDLLLLQLTKWNLVFKLVEDNESETAWHTLDNQITQHIEANNLVIEPPANLEDDHYFNLSWRVFHANRTNKAGISNYRPNVPAKYDFTNIFLHSVAWRDPIDKGFDVFFVGKYSYYTILNQLTSSISPSYKEPSRSSSRFKRSKATPLLAMARCC